MGGGLPFFGGGGGGGGGSADPAMDAQIAQNNAELEAKKQQLFKTRLDIIKSSGLPDWESGNPQQALSPPIAPARASTPLTPANATAVPLGMRGSAS